MLNFYIIEAFLSLTGFSYLFFQLKVCNFGLKPGITYLIDRNMEQPVLRYLEGIFGLGPLVFLIIIGLVALIVWKLAVNYTKKTTKMDNLPCDKHEKVIDNLSTAIQQNNIALAKLEKGQDSICNMINIIASSTPGSQFTQSHSPISLTEKGREIASILNLDGIINNNWDKIATIIDNEKNPYDIQMEFISKFIISPEKYLDGESLDKIKNDAYNRGVALIEYMRMLGVMSRDRYFSEHRIDVNDVDLNDPLKK